MATLLIFMCIDYVSGLVVAGVFKASTYAKLIQTTGAVTILTGQERDLG